MKKDLSANDFNLNKYENNLLYEEAIVCDGYGFDSCFYGCGQFLEIESYSGSNQSKPNKKLYHIMSEKHELCDGYGYMNTKIKVICPSCGGKLILIKNYSFFILQALCPCGAILVIHGET